MGKGDIGSLQAISPVPTVFKRLVLQTRKNQGLFGKGLNYSTTLKAFADLRLNVA